MDITTLLGIIIGIVSLILGFVLEGGKIGALIQLTAIIIVFGGTIGAVIIGTPFKKLKKVPFIIKYAFVDGKASPKETIDQLIDLSNISRREGLLALEGALHDSDNEFLKDGIQMIIDGGDAEMIQDIISRKIEKREERILSIAKVFEAAGGFAPTMGIIGTVMGLVHILGQLDDPQSLGPSIAVAFIATLYGVASANMIYLPLYNKVKARLNEEIMMMELQAEGLLSIQYGENSTILKSKLMAFLDEQEYEELTDKDVIESE
ncbi:chemotaxis protein MotA [Pullulanibacillus pueri]|uniref:Motility protein A n=1 Tax=Pullulanibacillus pueri TaxID=1437324 RepID=A0A8J2ZSU5_9BACL|nr:flagellar motor protein [Pullulanibacillus pueri]MBM7681877.1 chemotaxis protein MotA [Pullulanibacillus pueri]GGH76440.1 motility protein A [Pullulanibacillus pueri]